MHELKDHLGNVRVVLGDKKTRTTGTNPFQPDVVSYSGYFPFGMQMQEDTWQSPLYRYGYNGKEKDGELKGEGNSYDYGARLYDPRKARWDAPDKLEKRYPGLTTYGMAGNSPISLHDPDGNVVEATTGDSQDAVVQSIEEKYQKFVKFDDDGILDVSALREGIKGADPNSNVVKLLSIAENPLTARVKVVDEVITLGRDGMNIYRFMKNSGDGLTVTPIFDQNPSKHTEDEQTKIGISGKDGNPDGKLTLYINPKSNIGVTTAHELFGHAFFYMMRNYFHNLGDPTKVNEYFPYHKYDENMVDQNLKLNQAIKRAESQAGKK
ncbi:MAG: hypothetical protein JST20_04825 [Bacteroidetes bacterium]|nr:hypothetical protein [Bacteroidota bacterium]